MPVQYYALTKYDTTKDNPFAVARFKDGIFEKFLKGKWVIDNSLYDIMIGEFNDYENITEAEAVRIIKRQGQQYVQ